MTAVLLILAGAAMLALPRRVRTANGLGLLVAACGIGSFAAHAFQLSGSSRPPAEWWPSPLTAGLFALFECASWLLAKAHWVKGQVVALAVFLFATLVGLGHIFPDADLYRVMPGTGLVIPTVLGFMCVSMGLLVAYPKQGFVGALTSGATLWALAVAIARANLARSRAERERDEMRQLVAAAVTHDLRTPLQVASVSASRL